MLVMTIVVLAFVAWTTGRRGFWSVSSVCWVLLGVVLAGADSPVASIVRTCANAVIAAGTAFAEGIGATL